MARKLVASSPLRWLPVLLTHQWVDGDSPVPAVMLRHLMQYIVQYLAGNQSAAAAGLGR